MLDQLQFTLPELLSILGVAQCVYILVYMVMRAGPLSHAGLPIVYFVVLTLAFLSDFGQRYIGNSFPNYYYIQWAAWFLGPPLSFLLAIQIARITEMPALKHCWVLVLVPVAFMFADLLVSAVPECHGTRQPCPERVSWLVLFGIIAGGVSLLALWGQRGLFAGISTEKTGKSRYWLILAIVFMNIFFLLTMLLSLSFQGSEQEIVMVRTVLGLGFVYLVGTSLFRIYPQAVKLSVVNPDSLSKADIEIAVKVEQLLTLQKVYHEPTYSRADLARECNTSEAVISKIINLHFGKTFPQLMNERRIEDAKRLLRETDANLKTVAGEVGFNSLATFNRVFKDLTGATPGQFREEKAA